MNKTASAFPSRARLAAVVPFLSGPNPFSGWWLAIVGACVSAGAALRLINLGKYGFWTDEYFHVFAARSFNENGSLFVPMVGIYDRAVEITYITAAMFKVFGESEFTARLPFALAAIVFLPVFAVVTRRFFSETVSAVASFGLAFAPFGVDIARECRFYTLHQLFFFAAAMALFTGFENASGRANRAGHHPSMDWRWLAATAPLALIALRLQELTVNLGIIFGCYVVSMAAVTGARQGWWKAVISKYGLTFALAVGAVIAAFVAAPEIIADKLREATQIHGWQVSKGYDSRFYRYFLVDNFPALSFLFPVGIYVAVRRYGKTGLYAVCASAPLLFAHSFIFARKSERYIFYFFPFFLIIAAVAAEPLLAAAWDRARHALKSEPLRAKVVAAAFVLPGFLVLVHPWAASSFKAPFRAKHPDWKSLDPQFKRNLHGAEVITTNPQHFLYYVGKYPEHYRLAEIRKKHTYENDLLRSDEEFRAAIRRSREIYFVGAEWNFYNEGFMSEGMRNAVAYTMAPVDHAGDRRILAYHK